MKISYAITVYNELEEIQRLIPYLIKHKSEEDEIVVLWDNRGPNDIFNYLAPFHESLEIQFHQSYFENNFAEWKNKLTAECSGDYIVNIDADEIPSDDFQNNLVDIIKENPEIDVFLIPRWNRVEGLTEAHVKQWRWNVDDFGRINWPDYQMRVYKNDQHIVWTNKVHEVLTGYQTFAPLPESMYFNHNKTIEKQEKQNNYYNTL